MWTRNENIDVGLAVLASVMARKGLRGPIAAKDIAEVCQCNRHSIANIEQGALRKLRHRAKELYEESRC